MEQKAERLFLLAQKIAERTPGFFEIKGPGRGDNATNEFIDNLRKVARTTFGEDYGQKRIRDDVDYTVDFYFPTRKQPLKLP